MNASKTKNDKDNNNNNNSPQKVVEGKERRASFLVGAGRIESRSDQVRVGQRDAVRGGEEDGGVDRRKNHEGVSRLHS